MPIADPLSWSVMGFGDKTAWLDFLGAHALWHRSVDTYLRQHLGADPYPTLPLGDGGGAEWHEAHQLTHVGEANALLIPAPPDFRSYDLEDREQFATWTFIHAQECVRLRLAAGL